MANLFNDISNGIVSGSRAYSQVSKLVENNNLPSSGGSSEDIIVEARSPNRDRPRISGSDPTNKIDSNRPTAVLSYPLDRPKYYISFGFMEYARPSQFRGLSTSGITDYITLPIPGQLIDSSNFNYSAEAGNLVIDAISSALPTTGAIDMSAQGIGRLLEAAGGGAMGQATKSTLDVIAGVLGGETALKGAAQLLGLADNPMMTVMFGGSTFKQHSFSWRITPRSADETIVAQKIINTFKRVAHPEILTAALGGFYKFPNIVLPKFNPTGLADKLYRFKPCVITSVTANWQPNDRPGFHADDSPVDMILTIDLLEIELWRNSDATTPSMAGFETVGNGDFNNIPQPTRNLGTI